MCCLQKAETQRIQQDEPKKKAVTAPSGIMIPGLILLFGNASMDHIKLITRSHFFSATTVAMRGTTRQCANDRPSAERAKGAAPCVSEATLALSAPATGGQLMNIAGDGTATVGAEGAFTLGCLPVHEQP